jgi:hypothetical protein
MGSTLRKRASPSVGEECRPIYVPWRSVHRDREQRIRRNPPFNASHALHPNNDRQQGRTAVPRVQTTQIVRLITNESQNDKSARDSSSARTVTCSTLVIMTFPQGMARHGGYAAELATAGQIAFSWARTRDKRQKRRWHPAASLLHEIATVLRAATKRVTRKCEIYSVLYATKF